MKQLTYKLSFAVLAICIALCALQGCSSGSKSPAQLVPDAPGNSVLNELENLPTPTGVDPVLFSELKSAFSELVSSGALDHAGRSVSAGLGTEVIDLTITNMGGDTIELAWSYAHLGDYDQNGEVNVSDISPLGIHFSAVQGDANWNIARVADGDLNGEVNIADLTPIGQNFRSVVTGYRVESSNNPGDPGSWSAVTEVPFIQGTRPADQAFLTFSTQLTAPDVGLSYRVVPMVTSTGGGGNQAPQAQLSADPVSGPSPLTVTFDASGSSDPDGSITRYEWDWEDDGTWDFDSGTVATAQITYESAVNWALTARVRVTDDGGLTATATIGINITAGGFVDPPVETFTDFSQVGDTAERKWLLNCYRVLPPWQDADRCFQSATFAAWADEVLLQTNQQRDSEAGLPALIYDPHLELVAQAHARDMALQQYFAHENLYMMNHSARLEAIDHPEYTVGTAINGENLYAGRAMPIEGSPSQAIVGWMNSPGHRANILNPNVTHLGVGVYYYPIDPTHYYAYFVQVFANWAEDTTTHDWLEPEEVPAP